MIPQSTAKLNLKNAFKIPKSAYEIERRKNDGCDFVFNPNQKDGRIFVSSCEKRKKSLIFNYSSLNFCLFSCKNIYFSKCKNRKNILEKHEKCETQISIIYPRIGVSSRRRSRRS